MPRIKLLIPPFYKRAIKKANYERLRADVAFLKEQTRVHAERDKNEEIKNKEFMEDYAYKIIEMQEEYKSLIDRLNDDFKKELDKKNTCSFVRNFLNASSGMIILFFLFIKLFLWISGC